MKKQLLLLVMILLPMVAMADDVEIDGICYYFNSETRTAKVRSNPNGYTGTVVIPESVTYKGVNYGVTIIDNFAFAHCSGLNSVIIPNSVTIICYGAFHMCSSLTSITISNSVTSIYDETFYGCSGLTSVIIPNSVTSIGKDAFAHCSGLTSVEVLCSPTNIESGVFNGCSNLTEVSFDCETVTGLFNGLTTIKSVTLKDGVTSIGQGAFQGCSGLASVIIPNSVTSIEGEAFYGCSGLTSVTIGNSVTSIGRGTFMGCSGLTSITIPNSVTVIGPDAFSHCSGITSITIPNSVTSIGEGAFSNCKQLSQLIFPESLKYLEIGVCYDCENLSSVSLPSCIEIIGRSAFSGCTSLEEFIIPDSVKVIYDLAFKNCINLKRLYWGESVEKVGIRDGSNQYTSYEGTFSGCKNLKEVHLKNLSTWCKIQYASYVSNPLYRYGIVGGGTKLFLNGELVDTLFVPNEIDIVRKYTFYGYTWLKSIRFPESDIKVEDNAFTECRQLNSVYFGESTIQLENSVFKHCDDIQYVVSKSREPYMYWDWTFDKSIYGKCILYIPTGTKDIYASTSGWNYFTKVKETDVDDPRLKVSLKVSGEGLVSVNDNKVDDNSFITALYDTDVSFLIMPQSGYQLKSFLINGEEHAHEVINYSYVIKQIHDNISVEIIFEEKPLAESVLFSDNRLFSIVLDGSSIRILGGSMDVIQIYDVSGKLLKHCEPSTENIKIELCPHNIYLIRIGEKSYKVVL